MSLRITYRVCLYDEQLKTLSADLIEAASDDEAVALARETAPGAQGEVWDGSRLVARLGADAFVPVPPSDWGVTAAG